jgi:hypothetical protein
MPSRDVQILRNFTKKMAAQVKQANPLAALSDPRVMGMLGGGALTGLGAYGLARTMQSDEDKQRSRLMPLLAGLTGAGVGAYGGSYLPQLLEYLQGPQPVPPALANLAKHPEKTPGVDYVPESYRNLDAMTQGIENTPATGADAYNQFNVKSRAAKNNPPKSGPAGPALPPTAVARKAPAAANNASTEGGLMPLIQRANELAAQGVTNDPQIELGR